jgi:multiple sugar transport system permease protein
MMFDALGFLNTLWTIILPSSFTIFGTFLLRQFYKQIPQELQEAAIVDGAKLGTVWWRVLQPLAKPAMLSLLILMVTWKWNEYLQPLVFLSSPDKFTIPLALDYFVEENVTEVTLIMAGAVLSSIPLIAVFVFAQKYFIRGVIMSGIKG